MSCGGKCGAGNGCGCGGRCAQSPQVGRGGVGMLLMAPGAPTSLPWNGIRVTGIRGTHYRARVRAAQTRGVGFIHTTDPAMPGTAQPAGAGRFFDRGLGAAEVTWSIAPPIVQAIARAAADAAVVCRLGRSTRSPDRPKEFAGRGLYRIALVDAITHCFAPTSARESWNKLVSGESSDAGVVTSVLSTVGRFASALASLIGSPETAAAVTQVTSQPAMMQAELAMAREAVGGSYSYRAILAKGGRLIPVTLPRGGASSGIGVGGYVAIGAGVLAVLGAGAYALSRRRQTRLAGVLLAAA